MRFRRAAPERDPLDPTRFESPEEYAYALCRAGVESERARLLLRAAIKRWRAQEAAELERERAADADEARMEAAALASLALLRQVGYEDDLGPTHYHERQARMTDQIDPYKAAAESRIRAAIEGQGPVDVDGYDRAYKQRRDAAQAQVDLREELIVLGAHPPELPESVRQIAATESHNDSVQRILDQMHQTKRDALRASMEPVRPRNDGSQLDLATDATGQKMEAERALAGIGQIARHQAMAKAGRAYTSAEAQFAADVAAREAQTRSRDA